VIEGESVRKLSKDSGYSEAKVKRIKNYWLEQEPCQDIGYSRFKYLIFDGTYFGKGECFLTLIDARNGAVLGYEFTDREGRENTYLFLRGLKEKGLNPKAITTDGNRPVMAAIREAWEGIIIQRCLYHIQREGMRWLRSYPRTQAGKDLRWLLMNLSIFKGYSGKRGFLREYGIWLTRYGDFVKHLPIADIACKDLKKAMALINNAKADMFHFVANNNVASTTNKLEGFYSRMKADCYRHRGLSKEHRKSFLKWYCYFSNKKIAGVSKKN